MEVVKGNENQYVNAYFYIQIWFGIDFKVYSYFILFTTVTTPTCRIFVQIIKIGWQEVPGRGRGTLKSDRYSCWYYTRRYICEWKKESVANNRNKNIANLEMCFEFQHISK